MFRANRMMMLLIGVLMLWTALSWAEVPWPQYQHDGQRTSRSQYPGPDNSILKGGKSQHLPHIRVFGGIGTWTGTAREIELLKKWEAEHFEFTSNGDILAYRRYNPDMIGVMVSTPDTIYDDDFAELDVACQGAGKDFEDCFIHFAGDTSVYMTEFEDWRGVWITGTITGWDQANDKNGNGYLDDDEFAELLNPNATARKREESRIPDAQGGWEIARLRANMGNPFYQDYYIDQLKDDLAKDLGDGITWDGVYIDGMQGNIELPSIKSGGAVLEYPDKTQYRNDLLSLLDKIKDAVGEKLIGGDAGSTQYLSIEEKTDYIKRFCFSYEIDWGRFEKYSNYLENTRSRELTNIIHYPLGWTADNRRKIYGLATFYLVQNPSYDYFSYGYCNGLTKEGWIKAIETDIGRPKGTWTIFAEGDDPYDGKPYKVYVRRYDTALILVKPRTCWAGPAGTETATYHNLDGEYYSLQSDGTIIGPISSISLMNYEAVILLEPAYIKPDLGVKDFRFHPEDLLPEEKATVTVRVYNKGNWKAENIDVSFFEGEHKIEDQTIALLYPGSVTTLQILWENVCNEAEISVCIDPDNTIEEFNEGNNQVKDSVREYRRRIFKLKTEKVADTQEIITPSYFKLIFDSDVNVLTYPGEHGAQGARIWSTYDLEHDPDETTNISSYSQDLIGDGIWKGTIEMIESSPTRVIMELKGSFGGPEYETKVTRRYTIYPTGQIYMREKHDQIPAEHRLGPYVNGVCCFTAADQHADPKDEDFFWKAWGGVRYLSEKESSFCLFHSNDRHPTYLTPHFATDTLIKIIDVKMDSLIAFHYQTGRAYYQGRWAHRSYQGDLNMYWRPMPPFDPFGSLTYTFLLQIKPDTMNDNQVVVPYVEDYRHPDALEFTTGSEVTDDLGDLNCDGYIESEGCYVMRLQDGAVEFILDGTQFVRFNPVFKILNWSGGHPERIWMDEKPLKPEYDYNAAVVDSTLILQYLGRVEGRTAIKILGKAAYLLKGYIQTSTGMRIEGVKVVLSGDFSATYTTKADGYYEFFLSPGTYTLNTSHPGYTFTPKSAQITIKDTNLTQSFTATGISCITLKKTCDKKYIAKGGTLTYTITYTNEGEGTVTDVSIIEVLPEHCVLKGMRDEGLGIRYWYNEGWQIDLSESATKIKWVIPEVTPGEMGTVSFTVEVR
ncbi:MAG: CARDB domain-containing protein [bacterium]